MISIETKRLLLRNLRITDVDDYHAYMCLESTARYEDFDPLDRETCGAWIRARVNRDDYWAVELKENGQMIGDVSYRAGEYGAFEIGYDFHEDYGGAGYATEACRALLRHLFDAVGARRITALCNEGNVASNRLLERLYFRREGLFLEDVAFKKDAAGSPVYESSYAYAMLKREWNARPRVMLRAICPAEFPAFAQWSIASYAQSLEMAGEFMGEDAWTESREDFYETFPGGQYAPGCPVYIAVDEDGEDVGLACVVREADGSAFLEDFVVKEAFRGRGIGGEMLRALAWRLRQQGVPKLSLHVFAFNEAARRLYAREGFVLVRTKDESIYMEKCLGVQ